MAFAVPQHLRQRLAEVIGDLRDAVGPEAAKAYFTRVSIEPVELEPGAELCDDSWMEFIDEDCMADASKALCPAPLCPSGKSGPSPLQATDLQTEADTRSPAPSPRTINYLSPVRSSTTGHCKHCQESEEKHKRGKSRHSTLEMIVQTLPRRDLLDCLDIHWEALTVEGLFAMPSCQVYKWTLEESSDQARRLQHHLILRHLNIEDDLHQWRRSIAERRNLNGYSSFFAETQAKHRTEKHTRQSGVKTSSAAHKEYLAHIYADRTPKDYKRVKQGLKKDLRYGRRWSILLDGFVTDDGNTISGLGLGFLLLCGPTTARKMLSALFHTIGNRLTSIPDIIQHDTKITI